MSLADLSSISREQLEGKQVRQIIAFAGGGQLTDGGAGAAEFREFLGLVPSDHLSRYAEKCLSESFPGSGFALQDVVNQIGRRLGYAVTDGRYRGTTKQIGFDGLWKFPDGHTVVAEVKTTDAYRIDLETVATYRRELIASGELKEDHSSILIIVGREDTGDLEAQIRGSRHAWDVRLISVDALLRLMFLKERLDDPKTIQQICNILKPREFTRLDEIVDVVFSTAEETAASEPTEATAEPEDADERVAPVAFHEACVARFEKHSGKQLIRQTRSSYATPDGTCAVVCAVSKQHDVAAHPSYWFAFHPYQKGFLEQAAEGFLVLGCGSAQTILAIPAHDLFSWLPDMWTTQRDDRTYWHIRVHCEGSRYTWDRRAGPGRVDVTRYLLPEVFKRDLAGIEGKELLALLLEFKPDAANRKHYHLGEGVAYVLEGSGIYEQEGKPPVEFKSGDVRYKPANEVHRVKNASSTAPLKILVILIQGKGDPRAIPVK